MVQLVFSGCWHNRESILHLSWFFYVLVIALFVVLVSSLLELWSLLWKENKFAYNIFKKFVQTSGSLYGALIGSIVAFSVADTIGWFLLTFFV